MLRVEGLTVGYTSTAVLRGVDLDIGRGDRLAVLGRNGAGKTTLLRAIMGLIDARAGRVVLDGADVTRSAAHNRSRQGIALVPQGRRLFGHLTVRENLQVAGLTGASSKEAAERLRTVECQFPLLAERANDRAGSLSGGQQQMLAVGRALMTNPCVLLLDEPTEGIQPSIVHALAEVIRSISNEVAVLVVEQNLDFTVDVADRIAILDQGRIVREDKPSAILTDRDVQREYLGV